MDITGVQPRIIQAFRKAKLTTPNAVLERSLPELVGTTKLSLQDVETFVKAVSESTVRPAPVTALDLCTKRCDEVLIRHKLCLGCPILDHYLGGGIVSQGITEISGVSASGKTQVCLQLCLTVQLPYQLGGLDGSALYINTEDVFPSKRLHQMIPLFKQKHKAVLNTNVGDNIYVEHAADVETLVNIMDKKLPAFLKGKKVRLVVIDSIAALFRVEYSWHEMLQRARVLNTIGARLRALSCENNIPVVCVNQVSAVFDNNKLNGSYQGVTPSLGLTWSNQVTVRLMLSRTTGVGVAKENLKKEADNPVRELAVIFSPHLPNVTCHFIVDASGVHGIPATS